MTIMGWIILISFLVAAQSTCETFTFANAQKSLGSLCGNAVDYDFYVPTGYTVASLDAYAISLMSDSRLAVMPPSCQVSLKKLVCSNIFLKCSTPANYDIFLDFGTPVPMPFQRPCKSVCAAANTDCLGVLSMLGMPQDCSARYDYSHGQVTNPSTGAILKPYQYDAANNSTICNAMTLDVSVGSTMEPYFGHNNGGVCDGIISELYIPPANLLSATLAPLQSPGVVQTIIESELSASLDALPVWLDEKCHLSLKKYFCGSYMLYPQAQNIGQVFEANGFTSSAALSLLAALGVNVSALMPYTFYLPSYPANQVCQEYASNCGEFIALAGLAALQPMCDSNQTGTMIRRYPSHDQTITSLSMLVGVQIVIIPFTTEPNTSLLSENITDKGYSTRCPLGFVVPDDPSNPVVTWVPGSGCAMGCRNVLWTPHEWQLFEGISRYLPIVSFVCVVVLLLLWILDKNKRKQYLIICFAATSCLGTLSFVIMAGYKGDAAVCKNNSVPYLQQDGLNFCTYQGITLVYSALACCLSWLMQAIDLYFKIVQGVKTDSHWKYHLPVIFILPVLAIIAMLATNSFGYSQVVPWCFVVNDNDVTILYVPILIITAVGVIVMSVVNSTIVKAVMTGVRIEPANLSHSRHGVEPEASNAAAPPTKGSQSALMQNIKILRIPILFVMIFLGVWVILFSYRGATYYHEKAYKKSVIDWIGCIFMNYDGTDASWEKICGSHAKTRSNVYLAVVMMIGASSQSLLVFVIFIGSATMPSAVVFLFHKFGLMSRTGESTLYGADLPVASTLDLKA